MKHALTLLIAAWTLSATGALQRKELTVDISDTTPDINLEIVALTTPQLKAYIKDASRPYTNLADWAAVFYYSTSATGMVGTACTNTGAGTGFYTWDLRMDQTANVGTQFCQVLLYGPNGQTIEGSRGRLVIQPAGGAGPVTMTNYWNWTNYYNAVVWDTLADDLRAWVTIKTDGAASGRWTMPPNAGTLATMEDTTNVVAAGLAAGLAEKVDENEGEVRESLTVRTSAYRQGTGKTYSGAVSFESPNSQYGTRSYQRLVSEAWGLEYASTNSLVILREGVGGYVAMLSEVPTAADVAAQIALGTNQLTTTSHSYSAPQTFAGGASVAGTGLYLSKPGEPGVTLTTDTWDNGDHNHTVKFPHRTGTVAIQEDVTTMAASLQSAYEELSDLRLTTSVLAMELARNNLVASYGTPYGRQSTFAARSNDVSLIINAYNLTNDTWMVGSPVSNTYSFTTEPEPPTRRATPMGGQMPIDDAGRMYYFPTTQTWYRTATESNWIQVASRTNAVDGFGAWYGGRIWAAQKTNFFLYDPVGDTWTNAVAKTIKPVSLAGYGCVYSGALYHIGGYASGGNTNVLRYTPAAGTWTNVAGLTSASAGNTRPFLVVTNDRIYSMGGFSFESGYGYSNSSIYYAGLGTWTNAANSFPIGFIPSGQYGLLDGKLVVVWGGSSSGQGTRRYAYEFTTNAWAFGTNEFNRTSGDFAVLNNRLHIVGGASTSSANTATPFAIATVPYSQPAAASLVSDIVPLPFGATRVLACISLMDAFKYSADASTTNAAVYGVDWTHSISMDAGQTWTTPPTMTPILSPTLSNSFFVVVTNLTPGTSIMQKLDTTAGTVVRAKLWSRFGGK